MAEEPDPVGAAEDDLLDCHILERERLEVARADLRATFVAHQGEPDLTPVVLNVHLGEAMILLLLSRRSWGVGGIRHAPSMDHRLEIYCVTRPRDCWTAAVLAAT